MPTSGRPAHNSHECQPKIVKSWLACLGPNYTVIPGVRERVLYSKLYRVFDQCMKQNVLY